MAPFRARIENPVPPASVRPTAAPARRATLLFDPAGCCRPARFRWSGRYKVSTCIGHSGCPRHQFPQQPAVRPTEPAPPAQRPKIQSLRGAHPDLSAALYSRRKSLTRKT